MSNVGAREIVRFDSVSMSYPNGSTVFNNVSFSLRQGSFHFLTGLSGAGKSSLLKLIYLDQKPSAGMLRLFGQDVSNLKDYQLPFLRQKIGIVFQDFRLIPHLSVIENVSLPLRVIGTDARYAYERAEELLSWVGLIHCRNMNPEELSGGQQQRLAIIRAVIAQPEILLADEPTGNVDDEIAIKLLYLFQELNKVGTTVVVATHNQFLASAFPYPELHLKDGQLFLNKQGVKPMDGTSMKKEGA